MFDEEAQREQFGEPTGGGWLCLDFCNTADWRILDDPVELLEDYEALVSWSNYIGILSRSEGEHLLREAQRHQGELRQILEKTIELREALYRIFSAVAADAAPETADLDLLNQALAEVLPHLQIQQAENGFEWTWADTNGALDHMLWPVIRSAGDLLTSDDLDRIGVCANEGCGWLFWDTSRNRSRRWCDMKSCGNRAKARRYYRRQKNNA